MSVILNRHINDLDCETSFEFNVKNILDYGISQTINDICKFDVTYDIEEVLHYNHESGLHTTNYALRCYEEIQNNLKFIDIDDWGFTGRSSGWFVLCSEESYYDLEDVINEMLDDDMEVRTYDEIEELYNTDIYTMETIVERYIKSYSEYLCDCIVSELKYSNENATIDTNI